MPSSPVRYDFNPLKENVLSLVLDFPTKPEGWISLSGQEGSQERSLEFRDGEVTEGGMPSAAVVGALNPFKKNALREVKLQH